MTCILTSLALTLSMATSALAINADTLTAPTPSVPAATDPVHPVSGSTTFGPSVASSEIESRLDRDALPRPKALLGLYASLGVMNSLDLMSTHKALKNGAVEVNPTMQTNSSGQLMIKAVTTISTIVLAEQMRKRNKVAAIVTMIVANGMLAAVSLNNMHNAALLHK